MASQPVTMPTRRPSTALPSSTVNTAASPALTHTPSSAHSAGALAIPARSSRSASFGSVFRDLNTCVMSPTAARAAVPARSGAWLGPLDAPIGPYRSIWLASCGRRSPRRSDLRKSSTRASTATKTTASTSISVLDSCQCSRRTGAGRLVGCGLGGMNLTSPPDLPGAVT